MSELPPMSVAMTGSPAAMASIMRKDRASCWEELTYRSEPLYRFLMSLRKPINFTQSSSPSSCTWAFAGSSRGPSPASTRVKGTAHSSVSRLTESMRYLCPLSPANREAHSMTKRLSSSPSSARRVDWLRSPAQASRSTALKMTWMRSALQPLAMSCSFPLLHTAII